MKILALIINLLILGLSVNASAITCSEMFERARPLDPTNVLNEALAIKQGPDWADFKGVGVEQIVELALSTNTSPHAIHVLQQKAHYLKAQLSIKGVDAWEITQLAANAKVPPEFVYGVQVGTNLVKDGPYGGDFKGITAWEITQLCIMANTNLVEIHNTLQASRKLKETDFSYKGVDAWEITRQQLLRN